MPQQKLESPYLATLETRMNFAMGTPVLFTHKLERRKDCAHTSPLRIWARVPNPKATVTHFIVGRRIYSDGSVQAGGYVSRRRFPVYLVCQELNRAPVPVLEEDLRPLWLSSP